MKPLRLAQLILLPVLALGAHCASADDIDVYTGSTANGAASNLLIILDNSAAWNADQSFTCSGFAVPSNNAGKNVGFEQCGLYNAVNAIGSSSSLLGNIKLGLMYFPTTPSASGGQFVLPAASPKPGSLLLMDAAGIAAMKSTISALDRQANNSSNNQLSESMQEAWAFYQGDYGLSGGARYPGTNAGSTCGRNFVLHIALATNNTHPADGQGQTAQNALTSASGAVQPQLTLPPWPGTSKNGDSAVWADEWAKFMYSGTTANASLTYPSITTYTVILTDKSNPDYEQFLIGMANAGGGKYFLVTLGDTSALVQALLAIFNEVQAVNSVFASPGLPVTSNAQSTYLNQIYLASFRPDADGKPRWLGNLKQYQFGIDLTDPSLPTPFLADASWPAYQPNTTANSALSSAGTGFISPNAISYWTTRDTTALPDSTGGFWVNKSGVGTGYDLADGQFVEKGGVGQQTRINHLRDSYSYTAPTAITGTSARKLYTCPTSGSCSNGTVLSNGAATSPYTTAFNTTNASITATILNTNGPPMGITSISRSNSTATVTLASTPSPALTAAQTITIAGSQYPEFNGTFLIASVSGSTFTYAVTVNPPSPSTGTFSATVASTPLSVTSLTRSGTTVTASMATVPYVTNQYVTITGATNAAYNGTYQVTGTTLTSFSYTIVDGPTTPQGGGTATVGTKSFTIPASGIVRNASNSSNVSQVVVTSGSNIDNSFVVGATVTIAGAGPGGVSAYNGTRIITNIGNNCTGGSNKRSFCFNINTTPATPDGGSAITADAGTTPLSITGLSYTVGACTSPNYAKVLVTATTTTLPTFVVGQTVSVGGTRGPNEGAYVGTFMVNSVKITSPYNFTYYISSSPGSTTSCADSTSGMTASVAGVSRDKLINWVRGEDVVGDEPSPLDPTTGLPITIRGSVHGDVLHSRPAVINYGGSTGVVVFYGANDGVFRAINGNQPPATNTRPSEAVASTATTYTPMGSCSLIGNSTCSIGGVAPGGELWGFIASEFYSKLHRLYSNSPDLLLANTPTSIVPTPTPKDYFFDGATATYQTYDASGDTTGAYLFLTARRGGRVMYAIDVTNPSAPKFLWKITNTTSGFSELGQTWSQPKVAFVKGYLDSNSKPKPVLIFGAGYDGNGYNADGTTYLGNDDKDPPTANTMGRGIYIVDAMTGALVWNAGPGGSGTTCAGNPCLLPAMTHSIAADVTTLDSDLDGYIDRLYATDTGGNIWRVDLEASTGLPGTWQVSRLASLGGRVATGASVRKFLFPADVVLTRTFAAVLVGTGDREHPLKVQSGAYNTVNRFYMILDRTTGKNASAWATVEDDSYTNGAAAPSQGNLFDASTQPFNITSSACSGTGGCKGYYLVLNQNAQSADSGASKLGEQVVNAATTVGGFTFFGTNQPKPADANSCTANLGNARGYKINVLTGSGGFTLFDGGGLPPSPVGGRVAVYINGVATTIPFVIGGGGGAVSGTVGGGQLVTCAGPDCKSSLGGSNPVPPPKLKKKRTYWNRQIDQ